MGMTYIIRNGPPVYTLLTEKLQSGTVPSNILSSEAYTPAEILQRVSIRSILGKYYLVILNYKERGGSDIIRLVSQLAGFSYVHMILFCTGKQSYINARQRFKSLSPRTLDSYSVSPEFYNEYIKYRILKYNSNAKIPVKLVDTIRNRLRGYTDIDHFLYKLAYTEITKKSIQTIIPKRNYLTVNTFPRDLFLTPEKLNLAKVNEFLNVYKFHIDSVAKPLCEYFRKLYDLYMSYVKGQFTVYNYLNYIENNRGSIANEYNALTILDFFKKTSPLKMEILNKSISDIESEQKNFNQFLILYKFILVCLGGDTK